VTDTHRTPAAASGPFALGGDLPVNRLGFELSAAEVAELEALG
jgi:hypothetical protein